LNIPNAITLFRIFLVPIFIIFYYLPLGFGHIIAAAIFALASITDWLDGYLARTLQQTSKLGAFLDPVADKLIVAISLVLLTGHLKLPFLPLIASIIIGREIVVSALREWMAEIGQRSKIAVCYLGKIKTAVQMVSIIMLLVYRPGITADWIGISGYLLLCVSALFTLWSMGDYLFSAWKQYRLRGEV